MKDDFDLVATESRELIDNVHYGGLEMIRRQYKKALGKYGLLS